MDTKELFKKAEEQVDKFIRNVKPEDLEKQSTCSEWTVKDLINHIIYEDLWIPELMEGKTLAEVGDKYEGDVVGEDFLKSWSDASEKALDTVESLKDVNQVVHLTKDTPASEYLEQMIVDKTIHAWDVARSTNQEDKLDEELVKSTYDLFAPQAEEWRSGGALGEKVEVAEDASLQTKLLALSGRKR